MTTKNIRVVGYLPPLYYEKLSQYIKEQELTESAAIVKIVKQFFEPPNIKAANSEKDEEIASLKADIAQIMRRLAVLEEAVASGKSRSSAQYRTFTLPHSSPSLRPLKSDELGRRLGVNPNTIEQEALKGEADFKDWSKRKDPGSTAWQKRGDLFHPLSD